MDYPKVTYKPGMTTDRAGWEERARKALESELWDYAKHAMKRAPSLTVSTYIRHIRNDYYKGEKPLDQRNLRMQGSWNGQGPCGPDAFLWQQGVAEIHGQQAHGCVDMAYKRPKEKDIEAALAEEILSQTALRDFCDCESVKLYRGFASFDIEPAKQLPVRTLSSWTFDKQWAETVARRICAGQDSSCKPVVAEKEILIERVAAWAPVSAFLPEGEQEVVIRSEDYFEDLMNQTISQVKELTE